MLETGLQLLSIEVRERRRENMDNNIRVQFYHWNMGLFRKSYIQDISREEFEAIQRADKGPKVIEIPPDDWYGKKLPTTLHTTSTSGNGVGQHEFYP